jgi:hypothetical protein
VVRILAEGFMHFLGRISSGSVAVPIHTRLLSSESTFSPAHQQLRGLALLRIDAAALRLQSVYTGIERCFLQISRVLPGDTPDGGDWHRRFLDRMGQPTEERPAVLREASIASLQELLCFRHLVRHL